MSAGALRSITAAHGILAWSALLAAVAAAWIAAKRPKRRAIAAALATSLMTATGALGLILHEPYQRRLRQPIFVQSARIGWLFERKEHFAFGAVLLGLCAFVALIAAEARARRLGAAAPDAIITNLHQAVVRAYATSAFLAALAATASAIVASYRGF